MDVANEILDAIEIIVDKKIRENTAQIYFGVCKGVGGDSCVMSINGKNNTIHFYGSAPIVGLTYRVFVPNGNMSMAFAIPGNDDRKGLYYSNPNLFDNWYFGNPVNQRGQVEYTTSGYTIDRWSLQAINYGTLIVNNGYITLSAKDNDGLWQKIPTSQLVSGYKYTISVLTDTGLFSKTVTITESFSHYLYDNSIWSFAAGKDDDVWLVYPLVIYNQSSAQLINVKAAKLELGTQQTLAHQDADGNWVLNEIPDYGEQLLRCQRYFQTFATESLRPTDALDFRPVMRANPALSTITIDGKTLYIASADL